MTSEKRDEIEFLYGSPTTVLSDCLRGFLTAPKSMDFIGVDFSAIEARVLAWCAGEDGILDIFKLGDDIYIYSASKVFRVPRDKVSKSQRQIGKVAELALGYQGGVGAFQSMAKNYGVVVSDQEADVIKNEWRANRQPTVNYWHSLEREAIEAVENPGKKTSAGVKRFDRLTHFLVNGSFLWAMLPSGRTICYPYPKIMDVDTPWGETKRGLTYMGVNTYTKKWERQKAYGGMLCENIVQGLARDLLCHALFSFEKNPLYTPVMHIHDEVLLEVPEGKGSIEEVEVIANSMPDWASSLPMKSEAWRAKRYKK